MRRQAIARPHIGVARSVGYLKDFPPTVDFDEAMRLPREKVMVIATGGQGEPRAALARMASDSHQIKLAPGDTVIFSSKQIPGNEVAIGRIMNQLAAKDILTVTEKQAHIHVSGHPGHPNSRRFMWLRPKLVVPRTARLATRAGAFRAETGVPDALSRKMATRPARARPGTDRARPRGQADLDGDVIFRRRRNDGRRRLALHGQITVAVVFTGANSLMLPSAIVACRSRMNARPSSTMREAAEQAAVVPAATEKLREAIWLGVRRVDRRTGKTGRRCHACAI